MVALDLQGSPPENKGRVASSQGKAKLALTKPTTAADASPVNPKSSPGAAGIDMHAIDLWVKLLHGDFEKWGKSWQDTKPQALTFRWQIKLDGNYDASWELSSSPQFSQVVSSQNIGKPPKPGQYGFFTVDFDKLVKRGAKLPLTYYVRLKLQPRLQPGQNNQNDDTRYSYPVSVVIIEPGEVTQFQLPTITDVGPFSSCRPGGVIMLKGYDFGDEPGTLRLIGNFPDDDLYLYGLDWTSETVGGRIPERTGVKDQPVSIQLVTKNGAESNFIPCNFVATREIQTLPHSNLTKFVFSCDWGENYDNAGDVSEAWKVDKTSRVYGEYKKNNYFGCFHTNNDQGGTRSGTDKFTTQKLKNGWELREMKIEKVGHWTDQPEMTSYVGNFGDEFGKIKAVRGWKADTSNPVAFEIDWEAEEEQYLRYFIYIFIEGPKGVPFTE